MEFNTKPELPAKPYTTTAMLSNGFRPKRSIMTPAKGAPIAMQSAGNVKTNLTQ
jgi:hypothetical protein